MILLQWGHRFVDLVNLLLLTYCPQVYRRVVALPLEGLEWLWREFEEFEMAGNEMLWKTKFSLESLPKLVILL